jgi:peroxiredoxin
VLKRFAYVALTCLFLTSATAPSSAQQQQQSQVAPTNTAPVAATFNLRGIDGKVYDLSRMRGEIVLVSFGATWCAPCAEELAALEELKLEYAHRPIRFLWVSIETEDESSNSRLRSYAKAKKLTLPVLRDINRTVYGQFSERVRLPLVVIFDGEGKLSDSPLVGMTASPELYKDRVRSKLNELIAIQNVSAK